MYKKGHLGGGVRSRPLKIDMSVDQDIKSQSWYQIRKGSIKGLKNEKAKSHRKIYLTSPLGVRIWNLATSVDFQQLSYSQHFGVGVKIYQIVL